MCAAVNLVVLFSGAIVLSAASHSQPLQSMAGAQHGPQDNSINCNNQVKNPADLVRTVAIWFNQGGLINESYFTAQCFKALLNGVEIAAGSENGARWVLGKFPIGTSPEPSARFSAGITAREGKRIGKLGLNFKKGTGPRYEEFLVEFDGQWRRLIDRHPLHGAPPRITGPHGNEIICLEPCDQNAMRSAEVRFYEDGSVQGMDLMQKEQ